MSNKVRQPGSLLLCSIILSFVLYNDGFGLPVPEEAKRHFHRGLVTAEMARSTSDYKDAALELEKAKQLAPQWLDVFYNLGLLHEKTGNYDGAIENFRGYLHLAMSSPDAANAKEIKALI